MNGGICALLVFFLVVTSFAFAGRRDRRDVDPAECTYLEDCNRLWRHGEAYECSEGKCKCHPQATFDQKNKDCKCSQGYEKSGNNCFAPSIGTRSTGSCSDNSTCPTNASCINKRCECNSAYVMVSDSCKLVAQSVNDLCEYDVQCTIGKLGGYSKCESARCVCMPTAVPADNNSTCLLKKELGQPCSQNEQCSHVLNGKCKVDFCDCETGFVAVNSSCVGVVDKYNTSCNDSRQCQGGKLGYGSVCTRSEVDTQTCLCEVEFFYKKDMEVCMYAKGLGQDCDEKNFGCYLPNDGVTQNVQCTKGKCVCKKKFIASQDNKQCVSAGIVNHVSIFAMCLQLLLLTKIW